MDSAVARIVDANANRAREALRVIEEFVRFDLADRTLSSELKALRHELAGALARDSMGGVIRCRDTRSDVGRTLETASEYRRADLRAVVAAACKRVSEALRAIEECSKIVDPDCSRVVEQLRYRAYEIEQAVTIRVGARDRFDGVKLYVLITESLCSGPWLDTARAAIAGGADCLQLRETSLSDRVLLARARELAAVCREASVLMFVNDRPDVARLGGADGVHVGQDDLSIAEARRVAGPSLMVGCSTHSIEQARSAMADSADYIAVGPMFATTTKPHLTAPGPSLLAAVTAETSLPVLPIGGISDETLGRVLAAGARCACVCSAVIAQPDVAAAARALKHMLTDA